MELITPRLRLRPLSPDEMQELLDGRPLPGQRWAEGYPLDGSLVLVAMQLDLVKNGTERGPFCHYQVLLTEEDDLVIGVGEPGYHRQGGGDGRRQGPLPDPGEIVDAERAGHGEISHGQVQDVAHPVPDGHAHREDRVDGAGHQPGHEEIAEFQHVAWSPASGAVAAGLTTPLRTSTRRSQICSARLGASSTTMSAAPA